MMQFPTVSSTVTVIAAALVAAGSTGTLAAQTYHASPRGHLSTEGASEAYYFGAYQSGRYMCLDGELRGLPGAITEIAYRPDYRAHSTAEVGRVWNAALSISECDLSKASSTFGQNPTSTPTQVFSGVVAFPTLTGTPATKPAQWGSNTGNLKFPFDRPWIYAGTSDICLDYDFSGGVLANLGTWSTVSTYAYYLDGFNIPFTTSHGNATYYGGYLGNGGCVDANTTNGWGGYLTLEASTVNGNASTNPRTSTLAVSSLATAPNQVVLHAFGLGGNAAGTAFPGVQCNKLYVDLAQPYVLFPKTATGSLSLVQYSFGPWKYDPQSVGVPLWMQGVWSDSASGKTMLTNAVRNSIPAMNMDRQRTAIWANQSGASTGNGPYKEPQYNPVCRYAR